MSKREPFSPDSVVIGRSARMREVFEFVKVIADGESSVLITGESGTGKEMIANLIHHSSPRRNRPFVAVSCAILAETLIESELFGHERRLGFESRLGEKDAERPRFYFRADRPLVSRAPHLCSGRDHISVASMVSLVHSPWWLGFTAFVGGAMVWFAATGFCIMANGLYWLGAEPPGAGGRPRDERRRRPAAARLIYAHGSANSLSSASTPRICSYCFSTTGRAFGGNRLVMASA